MKQHPDEVVVFSGNCWGVCIEDYMRTALEENDFWNIGEYFTLASDGELVQAMVIDTILRPLCSNPLVAITPSQGLNTK